jgi:hypothetical protein
MLLAAELSARRLWQTANMSSDRPPDLHMLNVVVRDLAASLDFYRRLGIAVPAPGDAASAHVQLKMPGGFSLELDTAESARLWHAGWRADPVSATVVLGFMLPDRQAVDDRYAELTSAGYRGRQPPFEFPAEDLGGADDRVVRDDRRQRLGGQPAHLQQLGIPRQVALAGQQGAAGGGGIGDERAAQPVHQPGVAGGDDPAGGDVLA